MSRRRTHAVFLILLISHAVLLAYTASRKSACFDEGPHLAAGAAYWRFGETSIYNLSPPLLRYVGSAPAYFGGATVFPAKPFRDENPTTRHWVYFRKYQQDNLARLADDLFYGRIALLPASLLTMLLIFLWARNLYGSGPALIAASIWCFSPTVIAHGSTLGTDMGATCLMFAATYAWWRALRSRSLWWFVLTAVLTGAAISSKFTAVLMFPLLAVVGLYAWKRGLLKFKDVLAGLAMCVIVSYVILNACYRFRLMFTRLDRFEFQSATLVAIKNHLPGNLPVPFARDMVEGFDAQLFEASGTYIGVLFDHAYVGSDWRFYPFMICCKTTVGGLILLGLLVASFYRRKITTDEWPLIIAVVVLGGGMYLSTKIDLSIRYFLPAYPAVIVLIARVCDGRRLAWATSVAAVLVGVESIANAPRFHSFRNVASIPVEKWISDRDWGQSLMELREWVDKHSVKRMVVLNRSSVDVRAYGMESVPMDEQTEFVAISREMLMGIPVRTGTNFIYVRPWRELRSVTPTADLGGLLIFSRDQFNATGWKQPWVIVDTQDDWKAEESALKPDSR